MNNVHVGFPKVGNVSGVGEWEALVVVGLAVWAGEETAEKAKIATAK